MSRLSLKNDFKDGDVLHGDEINTNNDATVAAVNDNFEEILKLQQLKADVTVVDNKLASKVDTTIFNQAIDNLNTVKANRSEVETKADKSELANKADISYVNNQLTDKADVTYVNTQMNTKADKSALGDLNSLKTNTKTSAVAAINELVDNGSGIKDIDNISITKNANEDIQAVAVMNRNNTNKAVRTWTGTREEYDALENKDANTLYYITDEPDDYEVKANKTLTINELSTDEQYPSAKAVYNSLKEKVDATYVSDAVANKVDKDTYNTDMAAKVDTSVIGDLSELTTPDKDSIVGAINSIETQDVSIATANSVGVVKPDGTTTTVDVDGTLHAIGGGTGGTSDYNALENKPQINGVTLQGNLSNSDLGIKQTYTANDIAFTDGETFQQKFDLGELTGPKGDTGAQGPAGTDGNDATINGQNAINLVAGENIDIAQDGSNVTISSTGSSGGATYTAGTNIEITDDGIINNTIPYYYNSNTSAFKITTNNNDNNNTASVIIGDSISGRGFYNVAVGKSMSIFGDYNVALGVGVSTNNHDRCVLLGFSVTADSNNQFVLGSSNSPINEMKVVTSDGDKYIATTDLIETLQNKVTELENRVATLEGGVE